jgi:hypothetical protein
MITKAARRAVAAALVFAVSLAGVAAATGPARGRTYKGTTTPGGQAVSFKVSSSGKSVVNFTTTLGYDGKCGQGGGPAYNVRAASIPLHRDGTFKGSGTGTLGPLKPVRITVSGTIKGRRASGIVEEPAAFHCNTGPHIGANAYRDTFAASTH